MRTRTLDWKLLQEVLLWKNFAKLARYIDAAPGAGSSKSTEWAGESELAKEANGLVSMTLMNQKVLDALMESIEKNCAPIPIA
jgi:hypothetical protein